MLRVRGRVPAGGVTGYGFADHRRTRPLLSDLPQGTVIQPGQTWHFQLWHRDWNPHLTSNASDALAVSFQ